MMGESRTELLAWLNELLQLNYTKIEQCGTGAAYCQIIDSIYGDVPMTRVKMSAKHEYEFLANFKVLQNIFKAKKIDKPIPVDKLVKCKMQDNLEFLQWIKKFWDSNYGGQGYDAVARRKGVPVDTPATIAPISTGRTGLHAHHPVRGKTPVGGPRAASATQEELMALRAQVAELSQAMEGLERERDFYFAKLRDIEILVQEQLDKDKAADKGPSVLNEIQTILYSTEDGFEVPEAQQPLDEEETF